MRSGASPELSYSSANKAREAYRAASAALSVEDKIRLLCEASKLYLEATGNVKDEFMQMSFAYLAASIAEEAALTKSTNTIVKESSTSLVSPDHHQLQLVCDRIVQHAHVQRLQGLDKVSVRFLNWLFERVKINPTTDSATGNSLVSSSAKGLVILASEACRFGLVKYMSIYKDDIIQILTYMRNWSY